MTCWPSRQLSPERSCALALDGKSLHTSDFERFSHVFLKHCVHTVQCLRRWLPTALMRASNSRPKFEQIIAHSNGKGAAPSCFLYCHVRLSSECRSSADAFILLLHSTLANFILIPCNCTCRWLIEKGRVQSLKEIFFPSYCRVTSGVRSGATSQTCFAAPCPSLATQLQLPCLC